MAEVLENKMLNPEEIPEETVNEIANELPEELPEIKSTALTMVYAQELRELLNQLMDAIREANDPDSQRVLLSEYDQTLEKYDRLVNPTQAEPDSFSMNVKQRILQSCDKALKLLEDELEGGEIKLDEFLEGLATIQTEMERYANS